MLASIVSFATTGTSYRSRITAFMMFRLLEAWVDEDARDGIESIEARLDA